MTDFGLGRLGLINFKAANGKPGKQMEENIMAKIHTRS